MFSVQDGTIKERKKLTAGEFYKKYGLFIILAAMIIVMSIASDKFLQGSNWQNIMRQMPAKGLLAVGMTFILLTGGIDLSIGAIVGFASITTALVAQNQTLPVIVPIIVGCLSGLLMGTVNGAFVAILKIPAFITTLGMLSVAEGITYIICDARPVPNLSPQYLELAKTDIGVIPLPMVVFIVVFILACIILYKMRYGRYLYAIGGNREAAITSGLKVKTCEMSAYMISGLLGGLAAVLLTSRVSSGLAASGKGYELDAIAASVIGGVSLSGGEGRLWGTLIGVIILTVIQNALDLMVVSTYYQYIVKGALIIGAVYIDRLTKSKSS